MELNSFTVDSTTYFRFVFDPHDPTIELFKHFIDSIKMKHEGRLDTLLDYTHRTSRWNLQLAAWGTRGIYPSTFEMRS